MELFQTSIEQLVSALNSIEGMLLGLRHCEGDQRRAGRQAEAVENLADGFRGMNCTEDSHTLFDRRKFLGRFSG